MDDSALSVSAIQKGAINLACVGSTFVPHVESLLEKTPSALNLCTATAESVSSGLSHSIRRLLGGSFYMHSRKPHQLQSCSPKGGKKTLHDEKTWYPKTQISRFMPCTLESFAHGPHTSPSRRESSSTTQVPLQNKWDRHRSSPVKVAFGNWK